MAQQVFSPGDATATKDRKIAMTRKLAIRLYWMWPKQWDYEQLTKFGSHAGQPGNPHGLQ
jgi:hypothetical protein